MPFTPDGEWYRYDRVIPGLDDEVDNWDLTSLERSQIIRDLVDRSPVPGEDEK